MKDRCEKMANNLQKYAVELRGKNKVMKLVHSSTVPWRSIQKGLDIFYLKPTTNFSLELREINSIIEETDLIVWLTYFLSYQLTLKSVTR